MAFFLNEYVDPNYHTTYVIFSFESPFSSVVTALNVLHKCTCSGCQFSTATCQASATCRVVVPHPHTQPVASGRYDVAPRNYHRFNFSVDDHPVSKDLNSTRYTVRNTLRVNYRTDTPAANSVGATRPRNLSSSSLY